MPAPVGSARKARRHVTSNDREMPWRLAVDEIARGVSKLFSSADQRRRRPVSTTSNRSVRVLSRHSVGHLDLLHLEIGNRGEQRCAPIRTIRSSTRSALSSDPPMKTCRSALSGYRPKVAVTATAGYQYTDYNGLVPQSWGIEPRVRLTTISA
jgi:hypothetical protein